MNEYMNELKVPKHRIAVLIGEKGEIKKKIEKELGVKLKIDSREGDVEITGNDSVDLMTAEKIVKAIARGFNPKHALKLLNENYTLEIIDISEFSGKERNQMQRTRARLIGTDGKARKTIESLADVKLAVYGKTVSVIGDYANAGAARRSLEMLLKGKKHSTAFKYLENYRRNQLNKE